VKVLLEYTEKTALTLIPSGGADEMFLVYLMKALLNKGRVLVLVGDIAHEYDISADVELDDASKKLCDDYLSCLKE
jgi:hypothetical protein